MSGPNWRKSGSPAAGASQPQVTNNQQLTGEVGRVAWLRTSAGRAFPHNTQIVTGIGDDAAVLRSPAGHDLAVTTDLFLENVHFRRDWFSPAELGRRCLARGLSDLAAMGAEPTAVFLSLAVPATHTGRWSTAFLRSVIASARQNGAPLAGGDLAVDPRGISADIIAVGSVPRGKALLRSGARAGDRIFVTGALGAAAAALELRLSGKKVSPRTASPQPRIAVGVALRNAGIKACMDLSDGLSLDLARLAQASNVRAVVDRDELPIARGASLEHALHGGEDYELLFTAPPRARIPATIAGVRVTEIGTIARRSRTHAAVSLRSKDRETPLESHGFQHF